MPPRMHKSHRFDIKKSKNFHTPPLHLDSRIDLGALPLNPPLKISGYATGVLYHLFTIAGTNPYSWTLTDPRGSIILNKCDNALGFPSEYESNLTYVQQTYNVTVGLD